MSAPVWIAFGGMGVTVLLNLGGWLVAWGGLKTTVKALGERVATLEAEIAVVGEIRVQVARVEARMEVVLEQLRDLNAALRWVRADSGSDTPPAAPRTPARRRVGTA